MIMKNKLMAYFVILIMIGSTVAYVSTFFSYRPEQQELPESLVVEGMLSPEIEEKLLSNGFTLLRYYYTATPVDFLYSVPERFEYQVVVEKIISTESRMEMISIFNSTETNNITENNVLKLLCNVVVSPPSECWLR